jgi:tetraacyldisaccharide 4'-kinase
LNPAGDPHRMAKLARWLEARWYGGVESEWWLRAIARTYGAHIRKKRRAFLRGRGVQRAAVPVIVVGNLTVGGAGKTPVVLALAQALAKRGWRPGIVSRGYGGKAAMPLRVRAGDNPALVGDEPVLLARRSGVPVAIAAKRIEAIRILEQAKVDLVIADDGLQHYALGRDVEIVVIDGIRRYGNGLLLPAGPLREPVERADAAHFRLVNGGFSRPNEERIHVELRKVIALDGSQDLPIAAFAGQRVHAVAGIGNPERFFKNLRDHGIDVEPHAFPDHHPFEADDLRFRDNAPVLMTEKDAVKCRAFATPGRWFVRADTVLPEPFLDALERLLPR